MNSSLSSPRFSIAVFGVSLAIYLALAGWMTRVWKPLGDEPHYLLAAHSLVHDGDLDLANNYARGDYQLFFEGATLDPHVRITAVGQVLRHDLGLPFVLAPAYALGGRAGVEYFLACLAALLALEMFWLARDVTPGTRYAAVAWAVLAFTPPLVMYATLVYPELPGALIVIWAVRTLLFLPPSVSRARVLALALGVAALPWLSVRFLIVLTLLLLYVAAQWRELPRRVVAVYGIAALSLAAYFLVNAVLLAGQTPSVAANGTAASAPGLGTQSVASVGRGLVGWWIDPQRGTLILSPIYLLALAGIPRLFKWDARWGAALALPLLATGAAVALLGGFWVPFEVGARYFVVSLPLLAAPLALALQAGLQAMGQSWRHLAFGGFAVLLVLLSGWNGLLMIQDASYAYGSVVSAYSRALGVDVSRVFAAMGHPEQINPHNTPANWTGVEVIASEGQSLWQVPQGVQGPVLISSDLTELTLGNYDVRLSAAARNPPPDAELLTLDIYSAEGLPLLHTGWSGKDLGTASALRELVVPFDNPYFDRWSFPLTLQVSTTGAAEIWLSSVTFEPDTATTWARIAVWVALVLGVIALLNLDLYEIRRDPESFRPAAGGPCPT